MTLALLLIFDQIISHSGSVAKDKKVLASGVSRDFEGLWAINLSYWPILAN